ncbi:MAG: DUF4232 domain-containing protein [Actinomycetota bacterium]|nr:DUF4232 domain-containing protein [Actinomycetota bacterium]MDQ2957387.1 DUF4232 domain-containing protein [Actinomycetota bacterium]
MSKKTLPDELRSVLLAHSLDAPDPDETVERILADTVAANQASPVRGRRRWRPSGQLLGAAAVIAVVLLGAAGINAARKGNGAEHGSAASNAQAGQPANGAARQPALSASPKRPGIVPLPGTGNTPAAPPAPSNLGCTAIAGGHPVTGAHVSFPLSSTGELRYVYEFYCVGTNGQRTASELQVFQPAGDGLRYLSTLVPASKQGHLDYLSAEPDGVTVQGADDSPGVAPGAVVKIQYTTADGGQTFASNGKLVAAGCTRNDLSVTVLTVEPVNASSGKATSPAHQVLQLTNRSSGPCALEGFPNLVAAAGGNQLGPVLAHTLSGPAGGVTKAAVPPIVVLIPGGTAGAIIEFGSVHPSCAPTDSLVVSLPTGVSLGKVAARLSACGLEVHPLVDNPFGTD